MHVYEVRPRKGHQLSILILALLLAALSHARAIEADVKFSLASRRTFRYNTNFSSSNAVRNSAYGPQI
jgi:hypothetical protein